MSTVQHGRPQRGVSLIEALVALAVMAFGMLGVVGMQGSMRLNADIAKQRSEAVRIAQGRVEDRRAFWLLDVAGTDKAYAAIADSGPSAVAGITTNTAYMVTETVQSPPGGGRTKSLAVDVTWVDRTGQNQNVRLSTNVTGNMPELSGALGLPALGALGSASRLPRGRHAAIPPGAVDKGDGTSNFAPPGAGDISWVFNNVSGFVTQRCVATVCSAYNARLLSGYVRFSTETALVTITNDLPGVNPGVVNWAAHPFINGQGVAFSTTGELPLPLLVGTTYYVVNQVPGSFQLALTVGGSPIATTNMGSGIHSIGQPTGAMAESPSNLAFALDANVLQTFPTTSTVACFEALQPKYISYYCAVPVEELIGNKWSGRSELVLAGISLTVTDVNASNYKVCRYTPTRDAQPTAPTVSNENHPYNYANVNTALVNQNFLLIRAGDGTTSFSCPIDDTSTPEVNGNTWHHQPAA